MRRTCERGIDFDGAFNHLAILLNARSRDALLRSTFTSSNTNYSNTPTNAAFQYTSSSHFTQIHSNRNIYVNNISKGKRYYIPTVIIQGTHDKLTPLCNAQHLTSVIDGSKLIVINGLGHTLLPALDRQLANIINENVIRGSSANYTNVRQQFITQLLTSHL